MTERHWTRGGLIFLAWTLYGVVSANQTYFYYRLLGRDVSWTGLLVQMLAVFWMWALCTPLIVHLARRFRVERHNWRRNLPTHVAIALAFHAGFVAYSAWTRYLVVWYGLLPERVSPGYLQHFLEMLDYNLFFYSGLVLATHAIDFHRLYQERIVQALRLESQLTRAQLQALKMQIHPHFLFNTLHTISHLVHENPERADHMIAQLGGLLRLTIDREGIQQVPLQQELEFLRAYLEIEQTRFGERLRVEWDVDPKTLHAEVPSLILQPLVENAIRHGIAPYNRPGCVKIAAWREASKLVVTIADNGVGLPTHPSGWRERVGLGTTRARLEQLYGSEHCFGLTNATQGGTLATIVIPFAPSAAEYAGMYESLHP